MKTIKSGIYIIINGYNKKVYIGQTVDFYTSYKHHFAKNGVNKRHNKNLSKAFLIYGANRFEFIILEYVNFPIDFIKNRDNYKNYLAPYENKWIDYYDSRNSLYGYNMLPGGVTTLGAAFYQSKEFKEKCREGAKNKPPMSEETRLKIIKNSPHLSGENHPMWKKHHSEKSKKQMSEKRKGENNGMWDKHHSEKTKKLLSEQKQGEKNFNYGKAQCYVGKELFLHFPDGKHYFIINNTRFSEYFGLHKGNIAKLGTGKAKSYRKITGSKAPQWLVDKVRPLMGVDIYWVEVDIDGNIVH